MKTRILTALVVFAVCLCVVTPAVAQDNMPTSVLADRVVIGPQYVPRFLSAPNKLVVTVGAWTMPADSTWDYIEVGPSASIVCDPTRSTTVRVTTLITLPGGKIDCDVPDPSHHVSIIIRDVPLDATRDPFQWGNGILNFGTRNLHGAAKRALATSVGAIAAGSTTITLNEDPTGWQVNDELLIPDSTDAKRRETSVFVKAISGKVITLSKPLDFAHETITKPDGTVLLTPRVANLTRNIVIRSENPNGTRGHMADIGHEASWHVDHVEIDAMGRTLPLPIDDTTLTPLHIGTNVRAKYADHKHHVMMGNGSYTRGEVLRGTGSSGPKWGYVVHASHDTVIEDSIAIDFSGAGFVTEDGYEVRNTFRHVLGAYNLGAHPDANSEEENDLANNPGSTGGCTWFRGLKNIFQGIECWDNNIGFDLFGQRQVAALYPSVPGGMADTPTNRAGDVPLDVSDIITVGNVTGTETWGNPRFPNVSLISAHNAFSQFFIGQSSPQHPYLVNPTLVGELGSTADGIHSDRAYVPDLEVVGGYIGGNALSIAGGLASASATIVGTTFVDQVDLAFTFPPRYLLLQDVVTLPLGTFPHRYLHVGDDSVWDGVSPLPDVGESWWFQQRGSQLFVRNWQRSGQDYQLFVKQQLASTAAWPSQRYPGIHRYNCPEAGLTMGQCWTKYGIAFLGEALNDADALRLDGQETGYARVGLVSPLGPSRMILTTPTPRADGSQGATGAAIAVSCLLTGTPTPAFRGGDGTFGYGVMTKYDGAEWVGRIQPVDTYPTDSCDFQLPNTPGNHTVVTMRVDGTGTPIASSQMTFPYTIGAVAPPPPPPPPPPTPTNQAPIGYLDLIGSDGTIYGWAFDRDTPTASVPVRIYVNGPSSSGTLVGTGTPYARPDVNTYVRSTGLFGFTFTIPPSLRDGRPHAYYAYGVDAVAATLLIGSPKSFTASAPIDCVVGPWMSLSSTLVTSSAVTVGGVQQRTETTTVQQQRTILTPAANGGAACPTN